MDIKNLDFKSMSEKERSDFAEKRLFENIENGNINCLNWFIKTIKYDNMIKNNEDLSSVKIGIEKIIDKLKQKNEKIKLSKNDISILNKRINRNNEQIEKWKNELIKLI